MTTIPSPCFVAFRVNNAARFDALCAAFAAIKHDKDTGAWRAEEEWLAVFDDEALAHFWWPTKEELEAQRRRWESAPIPERLYDPELLPPSWDFLAMLDAFNNGEYDLLECRRVDADQGRLEFAPHAFPYGGTGCFQMLLRAFGFEVTGEDDGTGYRRR
jgi:hypothetical protein